MKTLSVFNDSNYGDGISEFIVKNLFCDKLRLANIRDELKDIHHLTIGSILNFANDCSVVWGSGFISQDSKTKGKPDIRCVRGPLTRAKLLEQGIPCPEKYGDPAVLMRDIYAPKSEVKYKYGVIPHYVDVDHPAIKDFISRDDALYINIRSAETPFKLIDEIAQCEVIYSSSLHGLIMAVTYGKPCVWLKLSDKIIGGRFKFDDFFASVDVEADYLDLSNSKTFVDDDDKMIFVQKCKIDRLIRDLYETSPYERRKLFVSLTAIFQKQDLLVHTLKSLLCQTRPVDKIFLFLSEDPYLIDAGFPNRTVTNGSLSRVLADDRIEVRWVENTGPYRKLLPLLKELWDTDHLIITADDDIVYDPTIVQMLIDDYLKYRCCISYRGFSLEFDRVENMSYTFDTRKEARTGIYNYSTCGAGVLFSPSFFKNTGDLIFRNDLYSTYTRTGDDTWYNFIRILNHVRLHVRNQPRLISQFSRPKVALWDTYNKHGLENDDTKQMRALVKRLQDEGFEFPLRESERVSEDNGIAKSQCKLLITCCPKSGDDYTVSTFRANNRTVQHEAHSKDCIVSWGMTAKGYKSAWGPGYLEYDFARIVHQVRSPLTNIPTIMKEPKRSWDYIQSFVPEIKKNDPLIVKAAKCWYYWNLMAEKKSEYTFRVEDLAETEWKLDAEPFPEAESVSVDELKAQLPDELYTNIMILAEKYGYDKVDA